jgi:hypothetical protein
MDFLGMNQEDNISLGGINVGVFQEKDALYAVFSKYRKLHEKANWSYQVLTDDQIFLTPDLL